MATSLCLSSFVILGEFCIITFPSLQIVLCQTKDLRICNFRLRLCAVQVRFGSTDPCQSCTSDLDCSFAGMEFCNLPSSTAADDTTSFDDFRNYASPIDPRPLRSNPTTANFRFTQCQDLVDYLFGLNLEAMPNSCQVRRLQCFSCFS